MKKISASTMLILVAAGVIAGIVLTFAASQSTRHQEAIASAERELQAKANLLAERMSGTIELTRSKIREVVEARHSALAADHTPQQMYDALQSIHADSPVFVSLIWTDAAGDRIASSFFADPPPASLAYREHFQIPRNNPEYAEKLFIGTPVFAPVLDSWILAVTLRLETADGAFAGIAAGIVNPEVLSEIYAYAQLGDTGLVQLVRADGVLLTQHPYDVRDLGQKIRLPGGDNGGVSNGDVNGRVIAEASVSNSDVYVVVSQSTGIALARYWTHFWSEILMVAALLFTLLAGALMLARDMRQKAALAADIRFREGRSRAFAEASSDWFWEMGANLRVTWVSDSSEETLGIKPERFHGKLLADILDAGTQINFGAHQQALDARQPFYDLEFNNVGKDRDRAILVSGVPHFDADGAFLGYRGTAKDITALRQAERRFVDVVKYFPGRVMVFDRDERLVLFNRSPSAPVRMVEERIEIGDTFEEVIRKMVAAGLIDDADADPEAWILARLAKFRERAGSSLLHMGDKVIEAIERPMVDGGTISLRFDVTERQRAADIVEEARIAAETASQAKSEFLASMSHEFRTPLNAIIGFSQVLQMDQSGNLSEQQSEYVEHVEKSGRHLLKLVSEVLDLASIEAGKLRLSIEPVDTIGLLRQVTEIMGPVAEKAGLRLEIDRALGAPRVQADAQRLRQIVLNLISNAIKYNRPDGHVRVTATGKGDTVRISVEDDGIGIASQHHDMVFSPFDRLGAEMSTVEGTGIGLSLCKRLVEAMGGRIGFQSHVDEGSTFWIELPITAEASKPAPQRYEIDQGSVAVSGSYSLLYVEDNPSNLRLMESLIATLPNVRMYSAPSGPIGLDLAQAHRPDIIVLDLNLPDMSGFEILKILQEQPETYSTPVIALTAAARLRDIEKGLNAGFFRYITKPLDVNGFLQAVEAALESSRGSKATITSTPTIDHKDSETAS